MADRNGPAGIGPEDADQRQPRALGNSFSLSPFLSAPCLSLPLPSELIACTRVLYDTSLQQLSNPCLIASGHTSVLARFAKSWQRHRPFGPAALASLAGLLAGSLIIWPALSSTPGRRLCLEFSFSFSFPSWSRPSLFVSTRDTRAHNRGSCVSTIVRVISAPRVTVALRAPRAS